ncbi:MAG: GAF domain-containing protein [Geitlerinemataceae cyanobacterium]
MNSASPNSPVEADVIDVAVVSEDGRAPSARTEAPKASSSALTVGSGNFNAFLAPLNRQDFKSVVTGVEEKLQVVNQTLGMLDSLLDSQGFDAILDEMLQSITLKTGELLHADRATIFLLDEDKNELFTIVAKDEKGNALEIRFPANMGIAGEVATSKQPISIPFDFYDDPRSATARDLDKKNNYRTYTMLTMPLLNEEGSLVAVVQLINKLKLDAQPYEELADRIDMAGFTTDDETVFREFEPSIRLILESSKAFYAATQKQRAATALMGAVNSLSKSSLDLEDTLARVMEEAKNLMNADRSTLWLLDEERGELWTKLTISDGSVQEIRIPRNAGFAGEVAKSGEPLLLPFDIYDNPDSETAKKTDKKTGYRTCSMLCMPVFNADDELIGVTQLINKKRQGEHPEYDSSQWPEAPEIWRASFNRSDLEFMKAFNTQAGVALQNAKLFATVKQQEQRQKDILRSLSNGVISTDKSGNIIAANESATILLGISEAEATSLEGQPLADRIMLKEGQFDGWFAAALNPEGDKDRQQYYPNQMLVYGDEREDQSINLSINTMADALDPDRVNGALVVMEDISDEMEVKNLMYKYMTPEVAEALLDSGDTGLGGRRQQVSVLFSDIRSYTTLTEQLEPEEVVLMLNDYFEEMVDAVFTYGGTLDKYIGDALMAVFGFPAPLEDHRWSSIQSAIAMRQRLAEFNAHREAQGKMPISIGMGIHSDKVLSGNIGSSKRMELTSIGDGVNLASRLEGTSKQYGTDLIISGSTYEPHADKLVVRELDFITVKGKTQPVTIYELIAVTEGELARPVTPEQQEIIDRYAAGRDRYLQPAREKLSNEELIEGMHALSALSDAEVSQLSYDPQKMLKDMLGSWSREALSDALGEEALLRMLNATSWSEITDAEFRRTLPFKVKQLTPRLIERMAIAKLQQFTGDEMAKQMLAEEAREMTLAQIEKLIDLLRPVLVAKSKQAFRQAREEFKAVLAVDPKNKAAKLHVERCMLFEQQPPTEDWDGVWKLTDK